MIHGGDIYRNRVIYDFSVNVNPLGVPTRVRDALIAAVDVCERYPDPYAQQLKDALSAWLCVPCERLLLGNGASELFMAVVHALRPRKCLIPTPSFYGYEYAAKASGAKVCYYAMKRENGFCLDQNIFFALEEDIDLLVIANPNNPVGNLLSLDFLERLVYECAKKEITVLLDECFIDFCGPNYSMLTQFDNFQNLILARAFTKIFAIPGVRLGYLVSANKALTETISAHLPEWNLSAFAQAAGVACCEETDFIKQTVSYVEQEGAYLAEGLKKAGLTVFDHAANFILTYANAPLYQQLLKRGVLIRDCGNFRGLSEGYFRFAVKNRDENEKLLNAIGELI